ncbi:MAG TPA: hypothetical protein PKH18_05930 [Ottowia sp.]|nr:hypothetical protein [Ottowia sp.]
MALALIGHIRERMLGEVAQRCGIVRLSNWLHMDCRLPSHHQPIRPVLGFPKHGVAGFSMAFARLELRWVTADQMYLVV